MPYTARILIFLTCIVCLPCNAQLPFNNQMALPTNLQLATNALRLENHVDPVERIRIMRSLLNPNNPGLITRFLQDGAQAVQKGFDTFGRLIPNQGDSLLQPGSNPLRSLTQGSNPLDSVLQQGSKTAQDGITNVGSLLTRSSNTAQNLPGSDIIQQGQKLLENNPLRRLLNGAGGSNPVEGVLNQTNKSLQEGTNAVRNILSSPERPNLLRGLIPQNGSNPVADIIRQSTKSIQDGTSSLTGLLRGDSLGRSSRATNNNPFSSLVENGMNFFNFLRNLITNRRNNS